MQFFLERRSVLFLSALLIAGLAALWSGWPSAQAIAQGNHKQRAVFVPQAGADDGYVITEQNGQRVCQEATPAEALRLRPSNAPEDAPEALHVIYAGRTASQTDSQTGSLGAEFAQTGLRITLRATTQLDSFPEAKAAFIRAAQNWETQIVTPISIIIDVDFGTTFFGQNYSNANIIGQTSRQAVGGATFYGDVRSALNAGASNLVEAGLYSALPAGQVPTDLGDVAALFDTTPVLRALGLLSPNANPDTEPAAIRTPPRIGFNSAFSFDFDPSDGISFNRIDFDGTATHEIGHVLGFGSSVGQRELSPNSTLSLSSLDVFRFRPGVNTGTFSTAQRILSSGGEQIFFGGGAALALSTGRPDGMGGDGEQASHWKDNVQTGVYIGIMDPTASRGEREQITQNDLQAFDTIGYRIRSTQAQLDAAPRALDFGEVALNASVDRTLAIQNTGGQPLQVTGITFSNAQYRLASSGAPFTLAPNTQQNLIVRFTPTVNGAQLGTIILASNDPNTPSITLPLSGFGGARPTVSALSSGAAQSGTIAAPPTANDCSLDATQYTILVPSGATQLRIALTGNQDLDLYARFNQRVGGVSPNFIGDHVSDSPNSSELITVTSSGSPALRPGTYFVGVANCGPGAASYTLTATVTGGANALAAVSAASYRGTELTSESIASIFGQSLATGTVGLSTSTLPTSLLGSSVKVRDSAGTERLAPLFFVSPGQINFLVPVGTTLGTATLTVASGSGAVSEGTINIATLAPGLFAANANAKDVAAADALRVLANNTQRFESVARFDTATSRFVAVPIDLGPVGEQVFLVLYGTGLRNRSSLGAVVAQIGGTSATVQYAGAQGSLFGLDQVNLLIPRTLIGRGDVDVVLTLDGKTANTVRVNIK